MLSRVLSASISRRALTDDNCKNREDMNGGPSHASLCISMGIKTFPFYKESQDPKEVTAGTQFQQVS